MSADPYAQPPTKDVADIIKANDQFYEAIENGDMDLMRAVWVTPADEDSATCVHPGQPAVHGLERVLRSWAVVCARINYLQFFITDVRVRQIGDVAIVTCVENVLSELPGQDPEALGFGGSHYEAVNVFKHEDDGSWRLITHSSAPVFPSSERGDTDGRPA
jgi:ketosteroid isomerase-like protein